MTSAKLTWTCAVSILILGFYIHQGAPTLSQLHKIMKRDTQADIATTSLQKELNKLLEQAPESSRPQVKREFEAFVRLFSQYQRKTGMSIDWDKIEKLPPDAIKQYGELATPDAAAVKDMLSKLVVVKLNGGLGTSMGCQGPKSAINVRDESTFLDLTVKQIQHLNNKYQVSVPLVLMNSFNTHEETVSIIDKYRQQSVDIHTFQQSAYPRLSRDTLLPVAKNMDIRGNLEAWYPPGHGDFYESFKNSELLQKFISEGREYCFISNIDNLGATVDMNILNLLLSTESDKRPEFLMEVTEKTKADVKGGTLIQYEDRLRLLELAQVPKEHVGDFKSIRNFNYFNTNNLWIKLDAIDRVLADGTLSMEIIPNQKTMGKNIPVLQLETAVGAAMKSFQRSVGINVPRSRFLPVKKTSDLLLVMSNLYTLQESALVVNPELEFPPSPAIKLGDAHFAKVNDFLSRFSSIPDLLDLDQLVVSGDVNFGKNVALKGTVIIIANDGQRVDIPSGAKLENKIITGNLRILEY